MNEAEAEWNISLARNKRLGMATKKSTDLGVLHS